MSCPNPYTIIRIKGLADNEGALYFEHLPA